MSQRSNLSMCFGFICSMVAEMFALFSQVSLFWNGHIRCFLCTHEPAAVFKWSFFFVKNIHELIKHIPHNSRFAVEEK